MSIGILAVAEASVRIVQHITGTDGTRESIPDAYAAASWYRDYAREFDATRPQRWQSYVYFARLPSYHGRYINLDSLGHRVTPQPTAPSTPIAKVYLFGGSTMWGSSQREDFTTAAELSRRLQALVRPGARVEVTNFAETGYVFTQDVIALILQLRAGGRPDVVVFYDGINDGFSAVQAGVAGLPQNEAKRVAEFDMGRALDQTGFATGLRKDLHALRLLAAAGLEQLALVRWLRSLLPSRPRGRFAPVDSLARGVVRVYAEQARMVEALSQAYGFTPVFVWQPTIHGTGKPLAAGERRIRATIESDPMQRHLREVYRAIPPILDSAMATVATGHFIDATSLFADDTASAFVDRIGHNTESAVPSIVDAFWPAVQSAITRLQRDRARSQPVPR